MIRYFILMILAVFTVNARNISFFVVADPHYGYSMWDDNEASNKAAIQDMNRLPGTSFPAQLQENYIKTVTPPLGVIIAGDLTGSGSPFDCVGYLLRTGFDQDYQVNGEGLVKYPVFEGYGNHDLDPGSTSVRSLIKARNHRRSYPIHTSSNGLHYSWDWQDIHFVQLNVFPGARGHANDSLAFLEEDLRAHVGASNRGVILVHHYEFNWEPDRWFHKDEQEAYYNVIKSYHILAIFTGHLHQSQHYRWNNIPVFVAPSIRENQNYLVAQLTDNELFVAERMLNGWASWWKVPLNSSSISYKDLAASGFK